jgi:hypothetical protein
MQIVPLLKSENLQQKHVNFFALKIAVTFLKFPAFKQIYLPLSKNVNFQKSLYKRMLIFGYYTQSCLSMQL